MYGLSKKTKYALQAVLELTKRSEKGPVLIADLANSSRDQQIPRKFLEAILLELKNKGILASKKGKGGGYLLARRPDSITLGEIVRALDGPLAPVSCVSQTAYRRCEECVSEDACGIRSVMQEVRDSAAGILDRESLADLLRRQEALEQKQKNVLVYSI